MVHLFKSSKFQYCLAAEAYSLDGSNLSVERNLTMKNLAEDYLQIEFTGVLYLHCSTCFDSDGLVMHLLNDFAFAPQIPGSLNNEDGKPIFVFEFIGSQEVCFIIARHAYLSL